jgi:serine O-acetyltransferase
MIKSRQQLREVLVMDAKANERKRLKAKLFGDEIWKFILAMRYLNFYSFAKRTNIFYIVPWLFYKFRYHQLSVKLGYSIPYNVCDQGLALMHYGTIAINGNTRIGKNCKIHTCVNIGATGGKTEAPQIGNNVYIGPGVKIVGNITIADGVCLGAGAVVVKSIVEPNTTWAGVPAKKISNNASDCHLSSLLFKE